MTISHLIGLKISPIRAAVIAAALLMLAGGPATAQDKDPVVAKVNGTEIHQSDLAVAEEEAGQLPPMSPDAKKDYLVQFISDMILVSKAAEAKKMGDTPEFKRKIALHPREAADGATADRYRQGSAHRRRDAQGL